MKRMFAARAWGFGVGLLCIGMSVAAAACTPEPAAQVTGEINRTTLSNTNPADLRLSRSQRIRAISARSRAARFGHRPTESVLRSFDKYGNVLDEQVKVGAEWIRRPSTLPSSLAMRSLSSYLTSANLMSMTATITTSSWSDTLNSTPVSGIDTVWTDAPNTMQSTVRSSDDENLLQTSDVYYPSSGTVGQFENSNAGVVIAVAIGATDQYTEMSIYGTDWADGTAAFVSDTAGYYGSLRQPAGGAAGGTSGPGVTALMGHGGGSTAFLMTGSDPCTAIKVTIIGLGVATAGLLVAGVMLSSSAPPFGAIAARYMYKRALVTAATMITTVGLLVGCEALHPEYYPH